MPSDELRYPVLLERLEYDGEVEYSATVPDLPGCVTAGDSPEDAVSRVQDAIHKWIAEARQRGLLIPEPRRHSGRFTVRVPSWLHAELETLAELENVSLNQYVSSVLAEHVGMRGRPRGPLVKGRCSGATENAECSALEPRVAGRQHLGEFGRP